jgi:hypothetical protein
MPNPLIAMYTQDHHLIGWLEEEPAHKLIQDGLATLVRDKRGILRRLYATTKGQAKAEVGSRGSLLTDASRTVRKQKLTAPYWCWEHMHQEVNVKRQIMLEELVKDSVITLKEPA